MEDPDATLCSPGDPAALTRLNWLRAQDLIDESAEGAALDQPGSVNALIERLLEEGRIDTITRDNLMTLTPDCEIHGPYATIKEIGRGAMGVVHHARRITDGGEVALKVIKGAYAHDYQFRKRFENECTLLEQIDHEAICGAVDWDLLRERPWLAMRYVPGVPLNTYLRKHGALPEAVCLRIIRRITEGLSAVEQRIGIVHRDIKPGNIIIQPDDPEAYPDHEADIPAVLIDFGLAKDADADGGLTMAGAHMGTPAYMATEQIDNPSKVDLRADIYGLGSTLFHMLTGQVPFSGSSPMDILNERLHAPQPDPKEHVTSISEAGRAVVLTAMADKRENRFLSHVAMARAISKALEEVGGSSRRFLRRPLTTPKQSVTASFKGTTTSSHRRTSGQHRTAQGGRHGHGSGTAATATGSKPAPDRQPGSSTRNRSVSTSTFGHGKAPGSGSTGHGRRGGSSSRRPQVASVASPFDEVPDDSPREGPGSTALRQLMQGRSTEIRRNREREIERARKAVTMEVEPGKGGLALPIIILLVGFGALAAAAWKLFA